MAAVPFGSEQCPHCGVVPAPAALYCGQCGTALVPPPGTVGAPCGPLVAGLGCGVVLLLGFALTTLAILILNVPDPVALFIAMALATLPVGLYALLIISLDRYEKDAPWLPALAFVWGAVVAVVMSFIMEVVLEAAGRAVLGAQVTEVGGSVVFAPWTEEFFKGAALLVLFLGWKADFDDVLDGIVFGSLVALGFAMTENVIYYGSAAREGGLASAGVSFVLRGVFGAFGHATYTAFFGAGLGWARESAAPLAKAVGPVGGFLLAVLNHTLWNAICDIVDRLAEHTQSMTVVFASLPVGHGMLTLPAMVALLVMAWLGWRRQRQVMDVWLADEVAAGVVTPEEYDLLTSGRASLPIELRMLTRGGGRAWLATRRLFRTEAQLAFEKWRLARGFRNATVGRRRVGALRRQILALRSCF